MTENEAKFLEKLDELANDLEVDMYSVANLNFFFEESANTIRKLIEEIQQYRAMERRLQNIYGECDGLLETVVQHLEKHENIKLPDNIIKARLLTDEDVDKWEGYRAIGLTPELIEAMQGHNIAMMNDLEEYQKIGTVEGCKRAIETSKENYLLYAEYKAKVQAFEAIGTIEEFKALKEKSVAKKPITYTHTHRADCPNCRATVRGIDKPFGDYCSKCGTKIDWSK